MTLSASPGVSTSGHLGLPSPPGWQRPWGGVTPRDLLRSWTSFPSPAPTDQPSYSPGLQASRDTTLQTCSLPYSVTPTHMHRHSHPSMSQVRTLTATHTHSHIPSYTDPHPHSVSLKLTLTCTHTRLLHSLPQLLPHLHILTFTYSEHFCRLNCIPQNSYSPRTSDVTLFGNKLFTDVSKVRIEMTLYCIRVNPKSNESPYKRQKRTEEASKWRWDRNWNDVATSQGTLELPKLKEKTRGPPLERWEGAQAWRHLDFGLLVSRILREWSCCFKPLWRVELCSVLLSQNGTLFGNRAMADVIGLDEVKLD